MRGWKALRRAAKGKNVHVAARLNLVVRVSVLVSRCADLAFRRLLNKPLRMLLSSSTSQSEAISTTSCIAERMYR
jgi:hypothetical protein